VELQSNLAAFRKAGIQPVAVSYDSVDVLKRFAKDRDITYPLLADPESRAINAFKIRNTAARGRTAGIPHPGTFIIGKDGRIVARLAHDGYRERHTSAQIIEAAGK
jgi:peroxiredoxin